jgi:hypothetical protein
MIAMRRRNSIFVAPIHLSLLPRAIAFELSWQANVSGFRKNSIKASFVTGHDFSRAAKRSQKEAGL